MKIKYRQQHNQRRSFTRVVPVLFFGGTLLIVLVLFGLFTNVLHVAYNYGYLGVHTIQKSTASVLTFATPKSTLVQENQQLRSKVQTLLLQTVYEQGVQQENNALRKLLDAAPVEQTDVLARVIGHSNIAYGTLLVKIENADKQVSIGDIATYGTLALGKVVRVTGDIALINLFTSSGNAYDVLLGDQAGTFIGTSNGTGKILLPREVEVPLGTPVTLPLANGLVLGRVLIIERHEEEAQQTIRARTPLNLQTLQFITIQSK